MALVYAYFDVDPIVPIYIGMGTSKHRPQAHLKFARSDRAASQSSNAILIRRLRQLLFMRRDPPIVVLRSGLTYETALAVERAFIAAIGRVNQGTGTLFNLTAGGPLGDDLPAAETVYLENERALNASLVRRNPLLVG